MKLSLLIFIPTYNERENVCALYERIRALGLHCDILFMDDASPDGTGDMISSLRQKDPHLFVIHRKRKLGIGSAHRDGIRWAIDRNYHTLVTMDADFTHAPETIPAMLEIAKDADVVVASRFLNKDSLEGWNRFRKMLTRLGHVVTWSILGVKHDATGAYRVYQLRRVNGRFLDRVHSNGYAFFFESLFVLSRNGFRIVEMSNPLPPRTYGHSKMSLREIVRSIQQLFVLAIRRVLFPGSILIKREGA